MKNYLPILRGGESRILPIESICYIVQNERKVLVMTENGEYYIYGCVGDFVSYLDEDFRFARKYLIVNFRQVQVMEDCTVRFFNGSEIYLGRANFNKLRKQYNEYIASVHTVV